MHGCARAPEHTSDLYVCDRLFMTRSGSTLCWVGMAQIPFSGKRELRWLQEGDCMITFVEAEVELSDALWDEWVAAFIGAPGKLRMLTSWGDIQPSKDQWRRATRTMRDAGCKVAVVTESRVTSALAKAASWAGADMQAFRWEQLYDASVFLDMDGPRRTAVRATVISLRDCFGSVDGSAIKPPPSAAEIPTTVASRPIPSPSARTRPNSEASSTSISDAASQNLARVRQTSEEIQAKLAEVQARLRNRTRS